MHKAPVVTALPVALALAVAGCGASKSSPTSAASPSASAPATTTSAASSAAAGAYGQSTSAAASSGPSAALITTKQQPKLGRILAYGPKKLTVYLFEADNGMRSSCTGACADVWPPVSGKPTADVGVLSAQLGTITRPDGTPQVTYKGHPLYTYVKDKDDGDSYGEGIKSFGAEWYALSSSGNKVDLS